MDSENRLGVVLVSDPEPRRRLNVAALEAIAQRIVMGARMRCLTRAETTGCFEHLLQNAGCKHPVFEPSAIEATNVSAEHVHAAPHQLA